MRRDTHRNSGHRLAGLLWLSLISVSVVDSPLPVTATQP